MRLIDADAFAEFIKYAIKTQKYDSLKINDTTLTVAEVLECVVAELEGTGIDGFKNNPTIEPRKKGKWKKGVGENGVTTSLFCSECNYENTHWYDWNYCPNCGADMREGGQDE